MVHIQIQKSLILLREEYINQNRLYKVTFLEVIF